MRMFWAAMTSRICAMSRGQHSEQAKAEGWSRTFCLNWARSLGVRVSALETMGMRLTRVPRRFMISMSRGLRLHGSVEVSARESKRRGRGELTCVRSA